MKRAGLFISVAVFAFIVLSALACNSGDSQTTSSVEEVKIGKQIWMAKNLNTDQFRNGDPIPEAQTEEEWKEARASRKPAWCYFENDPANGAKFGKLYNWYAVNDPRGLAPEGWHIPDEAEWDQLTEHLGGEVVAGTKLKNTAGWKDDRNGTDESGFSALPGGLRNFMSRFKYKDDNGFWWSSTEYNETNALNRTLSYNNSNIGTDNNNKANGFSVRCVKD